jgi:hypothetical protein
MDQNLNNSEICFHALNRLEQRVNFTYLKSNFL